MVQKHIKKEWRMPKSVGDPGKVSVSGFLVVRPLL